MSEPVRWSEEQLRYHMARMELGIVEMLSDPPSVRRSAVPRARHMNKTEAAYDALLCAQEAQGAIVRHRFESVTLLLAPGCRYTPDFMVVNDITDIEFHEVKCGRRRKSGNRGPHMEDDARVKLLTAARLYPEFTFILAWLDQGQWLVEAVAG